MIKFDLVVVDNIPNLFFKKDIYALKGKLISKCLFGVFNFFQKTNENKSTWGFIVVK